MSNTLNKEDFEKFLDLAKIENDKIWAKPEKWIEGFKGQIDAKNCNFVGREALRASINKFLELMGEKS